MAINLADLFEHAVDLTPERVAVVYQDQQVSYARLDADANRLAHHLAGQGVGIGAHVGVQCRNSIEAITAILAVYKLRAVSVNVNYRYVADELRYLYDNADLVALVHDRSHTDQVVAALAGAPRVRHVVVVEDGSSAVVPAGHGVAWSDAVADGSPERDFGERDGGDHYVLYTGGTTGLPKGVLWRHQDVWPGFGGGIDPATGKELAEWDAALAGRDRPLVRVCLSPLIHASGQWVTFNGLFGCGTVVYLPGFHPAQVWHTVARHRADTLSVVGDAMARPLLDELAAGDYDVSSVSLVGSHSAQLSPPVRERILAALPRARLLDSIGSSESGANGNELVTRSGSSPDGARVSVGQGVIALDERDRPIAARSGRVGRLARSGHIPLGYYRDPAKTAELFVEVDGVRYVVPGDYVRMEPDGTMTLLGRGNTSINTGGEKVFGEEVEAVLKAHPEVFDAVVLGVPDERFGERVAALVAAHPGSRPDPAALADHVRDQLAGYKVPRTFWLVEAIVRVPSGKPDYRWARDHIAGHPPTA